MRFMLWYLGLWLHVAAIALPGDAPNGWYWACWVSFAFWMLFGFGLAVLAGKRVVTKAAASKFTRKEVANLERAGVK